MIRKVNSDYIKEVTRIMNETYKHNVTEKQVEHTLNYFTRNIVRTMMYTYDIVIRGILKIHYNKTRVAKYTTNKRIRYLLKKDPTRTDLKIKEYWYKKQY